ncbi:DegT/DnrJ/EryC1/StrS family aminotransferase [Adhaeretor mobilis]|uniref:L-glutamine:2-deoxy-scyllo-inosose aminotransferase n=1 Tax=Adhaeretor mobilis TaxID=1930276 RepID=A0A517MY79_9BACT|nr:aminotransferase class V-fold PLP-dependent enzyme [Adhaeretor mobilis]QDS99823.1 L-glutamine:2-deoxy-scyllo-inosose aminotransferase [Adhaeretor mobilis]
MSDSLPQPSTEGEQYPWPCPDKAVLSALQAAFEDGSWGTYHGPHGERLSASLAREFQLEHVALCCSGTIAVELALRGCGVVEGDEVILAGYDFPGNFRAIEAIGARPVLVDIEPHSWAIDPSQLEDAASPAVKAILVSHLHGGLADMKSICQIAAKHGWAVVEDVCQQPGATVADKVAGTWGHAAVLSFGGSKLMTAGRGGAVLTGDAAIRQRIAVYQDRGNDAFPLSEIQAAVLLPQLSLLTERNVLRRRRINQAREIGEQAGQMLRPVTITPGDEPAFYKHAWSYLPAESCPEERGRLLEKLWREGVPIDVGFRGFAKRTERRCRKPVPLVWSDRYAHSTLLLHHPILLADERAAASSARRLVDCIQSLMA